MPKNIVILLDGTSNEISADRTNVLRLYGTLKKSPDQIVYYDPGVGTIGAENAWLWIWRKATELWGQVTGWGLDQNVKEAYRFLVENYDNGQRDGEQRVERDRIYIFGFSRGAYSARVLAGFIRAVGLLEKRNLNLVDYAYRAYKRIGEGKEDTFAEVRLYERLLDTDRPPIRLLGLFDTVASVFEHGRYGIRLRHHAFTKTNTSVEAVRHAVAIDDRRTMYRALPWPEGNQYRANPHNVAGAANQDVREVWFTGVHCDVGGGYPEAESGLAKLPLNWMIDQTRPMGLDYVTRTVNEIVLGTTANKHYVAPDALAEPHNSMTLLWSLVEFVPRRRPEDSKRWSLFGITMGLFERRAVPEGARVHSSVLNRAAKTGKKPSNLPSQYISEP